jgi:ethanolamine-phosphate cytidylyltransferase
MIRRQSARGEWIPAEGQWPVDPQKDVEVSKDRIWIDGCFDFTHHGNNW